MPNLFNSRCMEDNRVDFTPYHNLSMTTMKGEVYRYDRHSLLLVDITQFVNYTKPMWETPLLLSIEAAPCLLTPTTNPPVAGLLVYQLQPLTDFSQFLLDF